MQLIYSHNMSNDISKMIIHIIISSYNTHSLSDIFNYLELFSKNV